MWDRSRNLINVQHVVSSLGMLKPAKAKPFDMCCIAVQACAGAFCASI